MTTPTTTSVATVPTDRPKRYGKQLVSHLSRRSAGEWNDDAGTGNLVLTIGRAELTCTADALEMRVSAAASDLDRLEDVLGRHLVRFGARDELVVQWIRSDGTPGTEQRRTED